MSVFVDAKQQKVEEKEERSLHEDPSYNL